MLYYKTITDINNCINLKKPNKLPIFLSTSPFDLNIFGMTHSDYAKDIKNIVNLHIKAIKKFDYDCILVHVDSCVSLEPIGIKCGPKNKKSPLPWTPYKHLSPSMKVIKNLKLPCPNRDGRMPIVLGAIKKLKSIFQDRVCITGHVTAPFSSVNYVFGNNSTMLLLRDDPELVTRAGQFLLKLQLEFAKSQIFAGADAIWIGDLYSTSHFISLKDFYKFSFEPLKTLIENIKKFGGISFYHPNEPNIDYIVS